jgi:DNA-binding response OmpR family regulator
VKQVLIIDENPLLREYLNFKLSENDIEVNLAGTGPEGSSLMRSGAPDLVILDYNIGGNEYLDVLKQKKANSNTANIPVILLARRIDQKKRFELLPFDIKKVCTKPLNPEPLFQAAAEILQVQFKNMDAGPGTAEVHVNENIIFIEISAGLNRDKLDLLYYKIRELVDLYEIRIPRVIVMISNTKLTFSDAPNLQKLLEVIIRSCKSKARYIRVLTRDIFAKQFVESQTGYGDVCVISSLEEMVQDLLQEADSGGGDEFKRAEILGGRVLSANESGGGESFQMRFNAGIQPEKPGIETLRESLMGRKISIVDDDIVIRELVKNTFGRIGIPVKDFSSGSDYTASIEKESCDLLFLDLLMPRMDGFDVLNVLNTRRDSPQVVIISTVTQRDTVIRAFQLGIRSYLTKPIKPQDIFKKAVEILDPNF